MEKNEKNKNSKHQHHHHHHRQFSMPGNLVIKHIQINNNNRISKHSKNNSKIKNISNHVSSKNVRNEDKKEYKHHHIQRSSSMASKKEKDFFKYKLENFGKDKDSKISFKKDNINPNMPRNMDKSTEKYFL